MYRIHLIRFHLVFVLTTILFVFACSKDEQKNIQIIEKNDHEILIQKSNGFVEILLKDSSQIIRVSQKSKNQEWILLSLMPADPNEARGSNEKHELYFTPKKYRVDFQNPLIQNYANDPDIGMMGGPVYIEEKKGIEFLGYFLDNKVIDIELDSLSKILFDQKVPDFQD